MSPKLPRPMSRWTPPGTYFDISGHLLHDESHSVPQMVVSHTHPSSATHALNFGFCGHWAPRRLSNLASCRPSVGGTGVKSPNKVVLSVVGDLSGSCGTGEWSQRQLGVVRSWTAILAMTARMK